MCIIVDANCVNHLVNKTENGKPVLRWLLNRKQKAGIILGGKLTSEVSIKSFLPTLTELDRAGRVHRVKDELVEKKLAAIDKTCKSNDPHIVALALAARCNLVFTHDELLHVDLKGHAATGEPISIYQTAGHTHLLKECVCPV